MTDFERLASELGTTLAAAVKLAGRAWRGEAMNGQGGRTCRRVGGQEPRRTMASGNSTAEGERVMVNWEPFTRPKGKQTRAEWWESVRPYHEQGRRARLDGVPLSGNPIATPPYRTSWEKGWLAEDAAIHRMDEEHEAACKQARERKAACDTHDATYTTVAEKLLELGIDPYQLRDYLAGLPEGE